jgi:hypothetical protein
MRVPYKPDMVSARAENRKKGNRLSWRLAVWVAAGLFLLGIFVGEQLSGEVNWSAVDFISAGALLFGSLSLYEIAVRMRKSALYRAVWGTPSSPPVMEEDGSVQQPDRPPD